MHWVSDLLTDVESKAADELQRRQPTNFWDCQSRLAAIAQQILENDDTAETAAFVQELAAWTADQARG